jgi:excisionase family DNA binding protein
MKRKKYFSIPELAKILGISRIAVYKRVKKGDIEAIRIGRNYAVPGRYALKIASKAFERKKKDYY